MQALDVVETLPPPAAPAVQPISKEQKEEIEQDFYRSLPQDESLEFIEKVLAYRRDAKSKKTIEEFASYQFPSKPEQSFSTIIFDALAKVEKLVVPPSMLAYLGEIDPSRDALIQFCETLVGLWERCISESYHEPLPLVLDWLTYALTLRTSHIAPHILHSLLPIAQSTVLLIAYPRFRNRPVPDFASHISVPAILELLKLTLYGCIAASRQATEQFWKHVRLDFILTMLSIRQPIAEFQTVTTVLASSVLRETVGPVVRNIYIYGGAGNAIATHNPNVEEELVKEQEQAYNTSGILDRLSLLLIETPSSSTKSTTIAPRKTCTPRELWRLRLQILSTLKAWSTIPHGLQHLITHNTVIGRIAKCLSTALDGIYGYPAHQAFLAECINSSVGLLHYFAYVCNKPGEAGLDIKAKTDVLPSGFQTYMLTLARLNSVERGVTPEDGETERIRGVKNPASFLLGGVSIATLERAQELLEDCVTPEEGDGIGDAFWSASRESQ